jgi:hypothetical protein
MNLRFVSSANSLRRAWLPVLLVLLASTAGAQTLGPGLVMGRVVGAGSDGAFPGVKVTLSGNGTTFSTHTDANGRFVIEALVDGVTPYSLTASLAGFETASRTGIRAVPGGRVRLHDIELTLACMARDLLVKQGLDDLARRGDTIAHVRVDSVESPREWRLRGACLVAAEVTATVAKPSVGRASGTVRFLIAPEDGALYQPGQELVVPLSWDGSARRFTSLQPPWAVTLGVVRLSNGDGFGSEQREMTVVELFDRLKELAAESR